MATQGQVGDHCNDGEDGFGWTGVTDEDKRNAGGWAMWYSPLEWRMHCAVTNAETVAGKHGSGYWSGIRSMRITH